jgi:hypothetical protein
MPWPFERSRGVSPSAPQAAGVFLRTVDGRTRASPFSYDYDEWPTTPPHTQHTAQHTSTPDWCGRVGTILNRFGHVQPSGHCCAVSRGSWEGG